MPSRYSLLFLSLLFMVACKAPDQNQNSGDSNTPQNDQKSPNDYAIFFACNSYENMLPLSTPINDAKEIAGILEKDYGFATEVYENPTISEMKDVLRRYSTEFRSNEKDPEGQLFIYLSGHGSSFFKSGYFMPKDAIPETPYGANADRIEGLSYNSLRSSIDFMKCQHVMLSIDAVYSSSFDRKWKKGDEQMSFSRTSESKSFEELITQHNQSKSRLLFASGGLMDETPDKSDFAERFLEGLQSVNLEDTVLTSTELSGFLKQSNTQVHCTGFGKDDPESSFVFVYRGG